MDKKKIFLYYKSQNKRVTLIQKGDEAVVLDEKGNEVEVPSDLGGVEVKEKEVFNLAKAVEALILGDTKTIEKYKALLNAGKNA